MTRAAAVAWKISIETWTTIESATNTTVRAGSAVERAAIAEGFVTAASIAWKKRAIWRAELGLRCAAVLIGKAAKRLEPVPVGVNRLAGYEVAVGGAA